MFLGIDPGPVNTGVAVYASEKDSTQVATKVVSLRGRTGFLSVLHIIDDLVKSVGNPSDLQKVSVERFVPYQGMDTAHAEIVNQFIGAVSLHYQAITLMRALDWKSKLCKYCFVRSGFRNPSDKFDKKCSLALAKHIFPEYECGTDHEADALCIAYSGALIKGNIGIPHTSLAN